jgi:Arc/MetJ family transcription regulator
MRTTLDLDPVLIETVSRATGEKTKKKAVEKALQAYLRAKKCEELAALIGNYDDFGLTLEKLEEIRREP